MSGQAVLERDAELARLAAAVDAASRGDGALVLLSGPAGIGKTALLSAAREHAEAAGLLVLGAAASELDRDFPFGLVHQLLDHVLAGAEGERRERLVAGAAGRAAVVLAPTDDADLPQDPGYSILHGLFWLLANLAEERPLALLVDDLHWADRASLRLLEYLVRRLESLPLLVVVTMRPNEPDAEAELLQALETAANAEVLRPRTLGPAAVAELLREATGAEPEPPFVTACLDATGGVPLLLQVLRRQAAEQGLIGTAAEAGHVERLGAAELGAVVRRRLQGLGDEARAVAQAAAVLGEPARLDDLAAVAELGLEEARAAVDRLSASQLLEPPAWRFVHPLVRSAVLKAVPPAELARLHALAAERMRAAGAVPARVAVHLLAAEPAANPDTVAVLVAAAHGAAAEGAPEAGVAYLRRALEEPPPAEDRARLLLELGELEGRAGDPGAVGHLSAALEAGLASDEAARARAARGALTIHLEPAPALDEFAAALADATDADLGLRLEALLLEASVFHVAFVPRRAELLADGRAASHPSPVMAAHLAQDAAFAGRPVEETLAWAGRATAGDALLRAVGPANSTFNLLVHAVRTAERPDLARDLLERGEALARREGLRFADIFQDHAAGYWQRDFGSIAAGLAQASTGLDKVRTGGFGVTAPALIAICAELLVEGDRLDDAAAVVDELSPGFEELVGGPFALTARGLVRRRQHRRDDAIDDLRLARDHFHRRGWAHAAATGPEPHLAELLGERGEREEALELARAAGAMLERAGLSGAAAVARRAEGLVTGGDAGIELLHHAADALESSPLLLQRAWGLYELGAALRRAGRRADAREPLRAALDLGVRIEAARAIRMARDELVAAGGRPVREALTGPAALTPSERRVADLALAGLTNREIAETLWITRKTVELHLRGAYGKLGIRSRHQLPDVLEPQAGGLAAA